MMTAKQEAAALREIAAMLLAAEERAHSILPHVSEDMEDRLGRIRLSLSVDADALLLAANMLDPVPWTPTLFQWERGQSVPVVK